MKLLTLLLVVIVILNLVEVDGKKHAKSKQKEEEHRKANFETWVKIAERLCDDEDYAIAALTQMDNCFSKNPMHFVDEPFRVCRPIVFNPAGGFGFSMFGPPQKGLNQMRKTLCSDDACKASWMACIKTMSEKFGTAFKPGLESEAAIMKLYDEKMNCYVDLLEL